MKTLFNDNWTFAKFPLGSSPDAFLSSDSSLWEAVLLPHDWLIYDTNQLYEDGIGCYRKIFFIRPFENRRISLLFEGVYMDASVYVNDEKVGEWKYGYTSFLFDITEFLKVGENTVIVCCVYESPNSRWYSGAGIYRDVYLLETPNAHLVHDGIYLSTKQRSDKLWGVSVRTELIHESNTPGEVKATLFHRLYDKDASVLYEKTIPSFTLTAQPPVPYSVYSCAPEKYATIVPCDFDIDAPLLWDLASPVLYTLETTLLVDGAVVDCSYTSFGFRSIELRSDAGFFLNGKHQKLHGVCMHHDLGALGAAFHVSALRRQLESMKRMGANAIRTSHNPPAVAFMELADEMGFLIVSEAFDMWERPKTEHDYGNFFSDWCERDAASWLRRDRNHPSLIFWSIGNEIYDTHQGRGFEITKQLVSYVALHDPYKNAFTTIGSNYIEWEGAQRCATLLDASGYNYAERLYETHHAEHPDWVIYGSETASTVQSRSIYHFPASRRLLTHEDGQCSSLGNCSTNWGAKNTTEVITKDRDTKYSLGQFIWTGWDYIGEPTPYFTKNSYFGQVDTAGFEKDTYYLYQAEWTDGKNTPMVHLLPYWDFNEGQLIDLRVYSNAAKTELFFNDRSLGCFCHDHENGKQLSGEWQLPYAPGVLKAVAYDENGEIVATDIRSSFGDTATFRLTPNKSTLTLGLQNLSVPCGQVLAHSLASSGSASSCPASSVFHAEGSAAANGNAHTAQAGVDLIFVEISAYDKDGQFVANARNRVEVTVSGAGRLVGLDNGDSTDYDQYKGTSRRLFGGKLLAIVAPTTETGEIVLRVSAPQLPTATCVMQAISESPYQEENGCALKIASTASKQILTSPTYRPMDNNASDSMLEVPIRKLALMNLGSNTLTKENPTTKVEAVIYPPNASFSKLQWRALLPEGIDSNFIKISCEGTVATLTAVGDGEFRLCCAATNGKEHMDVISELEFSSIGLGKATLDPYHLVSACLYSETSSEAKLSFQGGVYVIHGRNWLQFDSVDFGDYGSDEITLPIFSFDTKLPIEVWEGNPDRGGVCLLRAEYEHESEYNHYHTNTWKLSKRLRGRKTISIVTHTRISLQGFCFTYFEKAFQTIPAAECTRITGDRFTVEELAVTGIGNNVTLEFDGMDFSEKGFTRLTICGRTPNEVNTIHVLFRSAACETRQMVEFSHCETYTEQNFSLESVFGLQTVMFVFLPGSNFDMKWFRFE